MCETHIGLTPRPCSRLQFSTVQNTQELFGPAGLAFSTIAAKRGHDVTLYDASDRIGGQFNLAKQVPGKEEFYETLRYFAHELTGPVLTHCHILVCGLLLLILFLLLFLFLSSTASDICSDPR